MSLAAELAALKPEVLVAVTRPAAMAAQRATTTIPTVFIVVPDPIGMKLVNSPTGREHHGISHTGYPGVFRAMPSNASSSRSRQA